MTAIKQRPFAFSCILFTLVLFISFYCNLLFKIAVISLSLLCIYILKSNKEKHRLLLTYVFPAIIIACIISSIHFSFNYQNILTYDEKEYDCEFVIIDENNVSENYSSYVIQLRKIGSNKVNFKANLSVDCILESPLYKSYSARLKFSKITDYEDSSLPNYSFLSKGIYLSSHTDNIVSNEKTVKLFPSYYFNKANKFLADTVSKFVEGEENALIQALILGNKHLLEPKTKYSFRALGLSHMLAVSGMHLSILIGSLGKLIEKLNINKKKRYLLMIAITFAYAGLTGFSPSVKRAALMLIVYYATFLLSKNNDSITSLCIALCTICIISPDSIFDIGLWLSFLSTYGILSVAIPVSENINCYIDESTGIIEKAFRKLLSMLLYGIVPVMFSLPVIWLSYGEVAILSPITNILFTPVLLGIMYVSPVSMLFSFVPFLSSSLFWIAKTLSSTMLYLADTLSPYSPLVNIDYSFTKYIAIFFVLCIFVFALINVKNKALYFAPFIISVCIFIICSVIHTNQSANLQKLVFTNTYSGDAFLAVSNNKALLCDISGNSYNSVINTQNCLRENHITTLDGYLLTEYNQKTKETLNNLIGNTKIKTLYLPSSYSLEENIIKEELTKFADKHNIETTEYDLSNEEQLDFFGINITVKKVKHSSNNSKSILCLSFSNERTVYHYIGKGAHSTTEGMDVIYDWLQSSDNLIFGSYGLNSDADLFPYYLTKANDLFFANNNVFSLYCKGFHSSSNLKILNKKHTFYLSFSEN